MDFRLKACTFFFKKQAPIAKHGCSYQPLNSFSKIDFADIVSSSDPTDVVILNLNLNQMIHHTFPKIDQCCKLNGGKVKYDGIDNIKRIDCNMSQKEFFEKYINEREPVMMKGCQNEWKAGNWTIGNLLDRYRSFTKKDIY